MLDRRAAATALFLLLPAVLPGQTSQVVRFRTNLGDIDVTLLPGSAPRTVANFLSYANRGAFNNSVIHRSVRGFIFQGGGFRWQSPSFVPIAQDPPVRNEFGVSNTRGTIAMAKLGTDANSATNQWFFNLGDNSRNLNGQNGGFTVFGRVANNASLAVMDRIAAVPVPSPAVLASPLDEIPLQNYRGGTIQEQNLVLVLSITQVELTPPPAIRSSGVNTAVGFGGYAFAAPGSYIEIYGSNLSEATREWAGGDFKDGAAPTSLEGVTVNVNSLPAYVSYVSPTQVNVQIPTGIPTGDAIPIVLSYKGQSSPAEFLKIKSLSGGLLAPPGFSVNGKQYAAAAHTSGAYVSNGNIPGVPAAPAAPGETLIFYGAGFGPVNPSSTPIAGQIAKEIAPVSAPVAFKIGGLPAAIVYAGLAPNFVGVYQFNVTVPRDAPNGDLALEVTLDGEPLAQTLFLSVQAP